MIACYTLRIILACPNNKSRAGWTMIIPSTCIFPFINRKQITGDYRNHNAQPFIIVINILAWQHLCFTSTNLGIAVFDMDTV